MGERYGEEIFLILENILFQKRDGKTHIHRGDHWPQTVRL